MAKLEVDFIDPNQPQDLEKVLPGLLAQAIINKIDYERGVEGHKVKLNESKSA